MIPGITETAAGIKASAAMVKALQQDSTRASWPNLQESLMALYGILDEWRATASMTTSAIGRVKRDREFEREERIRKYSGERYSSPQSISFVDDNLADIDALMTPKVELRRRWRKSDRRAAARRGLRTMLSIYSPEFLNDLDGAIDGRSEFMRANKDLASRR